MTDFGEALRLYQSNQLPPAEEIARRVLAQQPNHDRATFLIGLIHEKRGELAAALERMERAIALNRGIAGYHALIAPVLTALGRNTDAIAAATEALRLQPNYSDALINLGNAYLAKKQTNPAIDAYRRAIELANCPLSAHNNLARALHIRGQLDDAVALLRHIIKLNPNVAEFHVNLANALKDQGRITEAIDAYRAAVRLAPDNASIHSALLYSLWFDPTQSKTQILEEHQRWNAQHTQKLPALSPSPGTPGEGRGEGGLQVADNRRRIGYLSPDLRHHVSGYLLERILAHHDHEHFEVFCYSTTATPDTFTDQLKLHTDTWHDTAHLSDEALAQQIRADQLDILIDVTNHMAGNRALVLARRPAPIQVNYLAYPATSGQSAIDYRITCDLLDPTDDQYSTESLIRMPNTFWCYGPSPTSPAPNDLPAGSNGFFTFGSLNAYAKVNDKVVALWCEVLSAIPNSKLILLIPGGAQGNKQAADRFTRRGIAADRISFVDHRPRDEYLAYFKEIDLHLDPFPYTGHTTSLDSIWMSVPFVTLKGDSGISRAGECILTNVGLADFIAPTKQRYLELCVQLAGDLPRLAALRRELRHRMQRSPLTDAAAFTRNLEAAYKTMWKTYVLSTGTGST